MSDSPKYDVYYKNKLKDDGKHDLSVTAANKEIKIIIHDDFYDSKKIKAFVVPQYIRT